MKKVLCALLVLTIVVLSACNIAPVNDDSDGVVIDIDVTETEAEYAVMEAFYQPYDNAEELIEEADVVIIGKVTDISFKVVDICTGFLPTEETETDNRRLTTIYDIDIITSYKGEIHDNLKLKISGGIKDYRVEEQLKLVEEMKADRGYLRIQENVPEIKIGETYLFAACVSMKNSEFFLNMIPQQSIYNLNNPLEKHSSGGKLENPSKYYYRNEDEYGSPIISAKDIISAFGEKEWDTFWSEWQRDNPDWEERLSKAENKRVEAEVIEVGEIVVDEVEYEEIHAE